MLEKWLYIGVLVGNLMKRETKKVILLFLETVGFGKWVWWCLIGMEGGGKGVGPDVKMLLSFLEKKMNLYQCEAKKKENWLRIYEKVKKAFLWKGSSHYSSSEGYNL